MRARRVPRRASSRLGAVGALREPESRNRAVEARLSIERSRHIGGFFDERGVLLRSLADLGEGDGDLFDAGRPRRPTRVNGMLIANLSGKGFRAGRIGSLCRRPPTNAPESVMTDMPLSSPDLPIDPASAHTSHEVPETLHEDRLWRDGGWTARVIKNEDDDGWAVEMIKDGEPEPALVGPWTMGRNKKDPKPLDTSAFSTLVKTASEVLRRHEQQLRAQLHKRVTVAAATGDDQLDITLDIVPDEDESYALLSAFDALGERLAQVRVAASFKLSKASAAAWVENDFRRPG